MKCKLRNCPALHLLAAGLVLPGIRYDFAAGGGTVVSDPGAVESKHFHSKGKQPPKYTIESQNEVRATPPFADRREFEEVARGLIAAPMPTDHGRRRQRRLGHGELRFAFLSPHASPSNFADARAAEQSGVIYPKNLI